MILKILTVFAILVFLKGCGGDFNPNIKIYNKDNKSVKSGVHKVKKGETLYSISKKYYVPLRSLIVINNLSAPYNIDINQRLVIPSNPRYTVKSGDSLYAISKKKVKLNVRLQLK